MDFTAIGSLATALAVLVAVIFGIIELGKNRRERRDQAALSLVRAMMSDEWIRSAVILLRIPKSVTPEDVTKDDVLLEAVMSFSLVVEALGYAVHEGLVPIEMVRDLAGGIISRCWHFVRAFAERDRRDGGSRKYYEWIQWLAEQLERTPNDGKMMGAYELYRDWQPNK